VYAGEGTVAAEAYVRQVRGVKTSLCQVQFSRNFPSRAAVSRSKSLYQLQELSRQEESQSSVTAVLS